MAQQYRVRPALAVNYLALAGAELLAKALTAAGLLCLGRVLGPGGYGQWEFVLAVMVFFRLAADFGLGPYAARELASGRAQARALLGQLTALRLILSSAALATLVAFACLIPREGEVKLLLVAQGLSLLATPFLTQWLFQGHDRMGWVALVSLVQQAGFAGLLLVCLRPGLPLPYLGLFECASVALAAVVCLLVMRCRFRLLPIPTWPGREVTRAHLRQSAPIGLGELAWALLWYCTTVCVGLGVGGEALGWFGAAHRLVLSLHTFVWLYFFNLLPSLARAAVSRNGPLPDLLRRSLALTGWGGLFVALLLTLLGRDILTLAYGPRYAGAVATLAVLAWVLPLALLSGHYRYTLIAAGLAHLECACAAAAGLAGLLLSLLLIPRHGAVGGAAALLGAKVVNCLLAQRCVARRLGPVPALAELIAPLLATTAALMCFLLGSPLGRGAATGLAALAYLIAFLAWTAWRRSAMDLQPVNSVLGERA